MGWLLQSLVYSLLFIDSFRVNRVELKVKTISINTINYQLLN